MQKTIIDFLKLAGWYKNRSFWCDASLLAISLPFFLFPDRFVTVTIVISLLWFVRWLIELWVGPKRLQSPFTLLVFLFSLWLIIPILISADPELTFEKAMGLLLGIMAWRFIVSYFHKPQSIQILILGTISLGASFVAIGFLAVDWIDKIPSLTAVVDLFPQQIISFSALGTGQGVQPNQLAGVLLWLYPLAAGATFWFWQNSQKRLSILIGSLALILIGILILSQSRGGWLGGLSALGMGIWLATFTAGGGHRFRHGRWLLPLTFLLSVVIAVIIFGPTQLINLWIDPPEASIVGDLGSLTFRQEVWMWANQAIKDFPLTGTGLGTFREVIHRLYPTTIPTSYDFGHAHNLFLQIALDIGLVGLIFYLAILAVYIFNGVQLILRHSQYCWVVIGLLAAQAGFHLYGLVDTIALGAKPAILFWIMLGLMSTIATSSD